MGAYLLLTYKVKQLQAGMRGTYIMIFNEDNSFNEIREKSVHQWLDEMSRKEDLEVRGGVKATLEHIDSLKRKIAHLESKNGLKEAYLKKMKHRLNSQN